MVISFPIPDLLFPMRLKDLLQCLGDVVEKWYLIGSYLKVPERELEAIRCNNRDDVVGCKTAMLQE